MKNSQEQWNILQSVHSDEEEEIPQIQKQISQTQTQNVEKSEEKYDENQQFDIKESIRVGEYQPSKKNHKSGLNYSFGKSYRDSSESQHSDWNDTNQIQPESNSFWQDSKQNKVNPDFSKRKSIDDVTEQKKTDIKRKCQKQDEKSIQEEEYIYDENIVDIGKSMFTSKPFTAPIKPPQKKLDQNVSERNIKIEQGYQQSVYLQSGVIEKKFTGIVFRVMDGNCYWQYRKKQRKITFPLVKSLTQQFLKSEILVPLIQQQQFKGLYLQNLLKRFTAFLNSMYQKEFVQIFNNLQKVTQQVESGGYKKYLDLSFLKQKDYSKIEILKEHMQSEISSLKYLVQFSDSEKIKKESSKESQKIQELIGEIQLMISFQQAEKYCQSKFSSNSIQQKTWKNHYKNLKEQRKQWLQKKDIEIHL